MSDYDQPELTDNPEWADFLKEAYDVQDLRDVGYRPQEGYFRAVRVG